MARQKPPSAPPQETLPVPVNGQTIKTCSLAPREGTELRDCPTNLDLTSPWGKAMAVAAGSPGDVDFGETGQCRINAVAYLLFPDERIDPETGVLSSFCRTVLFSREGKTLRLSSATAPHALHRILSLYTIEEWAAGLPIVVSERRSRKTGRTYHDLRVELPAGDPAT